MKYGVDIKNPEKCPFGGYNKHIGARCTLIPIECEGYIGVTAPVFPSECPLREGVVLKLRGVTPIDERLRRVMDLIEHIGQCQGEGHHLVWLLDQIVRIIKGDEYESWIKEEEEYGWEEGIAP